MKAIRRDIKTILASGMFDSVWYLEQNPDVASAGMNPVEHYVRHGWKEGRDPSPLFSTRKYLTIHLDVAAAAYNPLLHYIVHGRREGRLAGGNDYASWTKQYDTWSSEDLQILNAEMNAFKVRPRFSIIMSLGTVDSRWVRRAIESVAAQSYPHWELCISGDSSTNGEIRSLLQRCVSEEPRIRVIFQGANECMASNWKLALTLGTGEFITLLGSADELPRHALFWVAKEINEHPSADLIYSDEDKIDAKGVRQQPYFKPDWNWGLILAQNFFGHLGVYRRALVERIGSFREAYEGSQDHDLVLRCAEACSPDSIRHIPRVLYHWRTIPVSALSLEGGSTKTNAWDAGRRAIEDHLRRKGIQARVVPACEQYYQVDYSTESLGQPKVSVVMPSACKLEILKPCLAALFSRTTYKKFEVLLAINEIRLRDPAQAAYLKSLEDEERVRILVYDERPFNFSWINNWAVRQASGTVLCLMNDDVEVNTGPWLERLVVRLQLDNVGAVGTMLYYPNDTIQHAGVTLGLAGVAGHTFTAQRRGSPGYFGRAALEQDLSCVTAACMVIRRDAFEQVGGFNETLPIAYNDVDLCIRLRKEGWRILWTPQVEHYHHESASIGRHDSAEREEYARAVQIMRQLWGSALEEDPFYNPNLSLQDPQMTLAIPPRLTKFGAKEAPASALLGQ